mgnify:CR=1 FL=1
MEDPNPSRAARRWRAEGGSAGGGGSSLVCNPFDTIRPRRLTAAPVRFAGGRVLGADEA